MRPSIGIGITTKDRWDDLEVTLGRIEKAGLHRLETIVIDDGSVEPIAPLVAARFPWVQVKRSSPSLGYIAQRNRLAQFLTSDLYLSLDDDSYIMSGDLEAAAQWMVDRPTVIALAFRIETRDHSAPDLSNGSMEPYPVRFFTGCAHLLDRPAFLSLGGYREIMEFYCEEHEFSARAWKNGRSVMAYPAVTVYHHVSLMHRDQSHINHFITRNDLWIALWHYPWPMALASFLHCLPRQLRYPEHQPYWRSLLRGYLAALKSLPEVWQQREPFSWAQFRAWRQRWHPYTGVRVKTSQSKLESGGNVQALAAGSTSESS